jgi:hypothetical protein
VIGGRQRSSTKGFLVGGGVEGSGNGVEPVGQLAGPHAESNPEVLRMSEEAAGHDRGVLFDEQPIDELVDVGDAQQPRKRDGATGRRHPRDVVPAGERALHPAAIGLDDPAGAIGQQGEVGECPQGQPLRRRRRGATTARAARIRAATAGAARAQPQRRPASP